MAEEAAEGLLAAAPFPVPLMSAFGDNAAAAAAADGGDDDDEDGAAAAACACACACGRGDGACAGCDGGWMPLRNSAGSVAVCA